MPRTALSHLARRVSRTISPRINSRTPIAPQSTLSHRIASQNTLRASRCGIFQATRTITTTRPLQKGLSPETDNPQPKEAETNDTASASAPADITIENFHELSDTYLNALVEKLEQLQEEKEDVDCEYSAGVLTLTFPPNGTYVLNKQPPNKQIWLSSPLTGPKRFDFVMASEGQDAKEGTGAGEWVYLRDGTTLSEVLLKEVGVDMRDLWAPIEDSGV